MLGWPFNFSRSATLKFDMQTISIIKRHRPLHESGCKQCLFHVSKGKPSPNKQKDSRADGRTNGQTLSNVLSPCYSVDNQLLSLFNKSNQNFIRYSTRMDGWKEGKRLIQVPPPPGLGMVSSFCPPWYKDHLAIKTMFAYVHRQSLHEGLTVVIRNVNGYPVIPGQCCKFLSPGRPRLPVFGQGYLLPEAGSPGGRPKMPYLSFYLSHRTL